MTQLRWIAIDSDFVTHVQGGGADANGLPAERHISDGNQVPCRHCLADIPQGEPFLILANRPFSHLQPYAECGPIFLHAEACPRYGETAGMPEMFRALDRLLVRGYDQDERIVYGSGRIVTPERLDEEAFELLRRPDVAFLHLRSATNNCWFCRIEKPA